MPAAPSHPLTLLLTGRLARALALLAALVGAVLVLALVAAAPGVAAASSSVASAAAATGGATGSDGSGAAGDRSVVAGDVTATAAARAAKPKANGRKAVRRVGGRVRQAWPATGRAPRARLARWLARQVGPKAPRVCSTLPPAQRRACEAAKLPPRRVAATAAGAGAVASAAAAGMPLAVAAAAARTPQAEALARAERIKVSERSLELLRSYEIPADDPSYDRLLNWSWSYDSALAAAAFASVGDRDQAARLLDQLAALQREDGSIDIAFNVATGEASPTIRSGTIAWLGLAAVTYDAAFDADRYRDTAQRAVDYLLSLQRDDGLVAGGPDVKWVSTQHNLIAYALLNRLGDELERAGDAKSAERLRAQAARIGEAVDKLLLVQDGKQASFRQGLDDDVQALDTQALGSMYLIGRDQAELGRLVLDGALDRFALSKRSIERSADKATFNETYAAEGPFSGFRPYAGDGTPDVLWFEGTAEMRLAQVAFGQDTSELDASMKRWSEVTAKQGSAPLGADRTITDNPYGEYHVWPTGAAAAWSLLSAANPAFFVAPLPPEVDVVTDWTLVRGDEQQIQTYPDGRVDMTDYDHAGERRVLAGSAKARDYTVGVDAQLWYGSGFGVFVRSSVTGDGALTGYAVLFDRASGEISLRQWQDDEELRAPLAVTRLPDGYDYNARHRMTVTVKGNTLTASLDGEPVLDVGDLAAASAKAAEASGVKDVSVPRGGRFGLRAWSLALVRFGQFTVG